MRSRRRKYLTTTTPGGDGGGGGGSGVPTSGLWGHWSAGSLNLFEGDPVDVLIDQGPNGYDVTMESLSKPVYRVGFLNGHPVVEMNMNGPYSLTNVPNPGTTGITVWGVFHNTADTNAHITSWNAGALSNTFDLYTPYSDGQFYFDHGAATGGGRINGGPPAGWRDWMRIFEWHKPDSLGGEPHAYMAMDGTVFDTGDMTDPLNEGLAKFRICGGSDSSSNWQQGYFAELIIYDTPQSEADRDATRLYLANKYGLVIAE